MFPPPVSGRSIPNEDLNPLTRAYRDAVVYDGIDADDVLYEGPIVVHANGWIELEGNRLLSPARFTTSTSTTTPRSSANGKAGTTGLTMTDGWVTPTTGGEVMATTGGRSGRTIGGRTDSALDNRTAGRTMP